MRCSILFHLLVPGGKWPTETAISVSSAHLCAALTPAPVGHNQQLPRFRIRYRSHLTPPAAYRLHRKLRRIVIGSYAHPALIAGQIVDSIRSRLALLLIWEIMHSHLLRTAFELPFAAPILIIAHQFFLLGVDRNHRRSSLLKRLCLLIDMLKLRIPIRMTGPLPRFPIRLQAVALVLQNVRNRTGADRAPLEAQLFGQLRRALGRPA